MFKVLRFEDRIKLVSVALRHHLSLFPSPVCRSDVYWFSQAVRLESGWSERVRYMVVVYTSGHQDTEENIVLGMDFTDKDRYALICKQPFVHHIGGVFYLLNCALCPWQ